MVDFKKKLGLKSIEKKVNPVEIYDVLDRKSETSDLRPVQKEILTDWWLHRKEDKDLILKLHTGQGKTLIGLLMLQSKLNEKKEPCVYVCPNIYLLQQTCQEAEKFGISYVTVNNDNSLPEEFLSSEKILIVHVQKLFNGKSIFGIGGNFTKVNTILLDDSHACIDSINNSFKITVNNEHKIYTKLIQLFEDDLREQGEGSFLEIQSGKYSTFLPVPYWSWEDKKSEVAAVLLQHSDDIKVKFTWDLIKDSLENCQCFISGKELEISPSISLVHQFGTFSKAKHKILMSATTQNDSFFIKGLGLNAKAVKNPLVYSNEKWSGEKMILIPSLIDSSLDRRPIINEFAKKDPKRRAGIVVITPSFPIANTYEQCGSIVANKDKIFDEINKLKDNQYSNTVVLVNRYDGIDLPDNCCRILIIDSIPYASSLTEKYEEECRSNSDQINIKIAQKIEQGLGRSVRGEKDYSVILIIGYDLVKFIKSINSNKFFSEQTRKQIEIGIEIGKFAEEELEEKRQQPLDVVMDLINQCLKRDEGWKEFYKEKMDEVVTMESSNGKNFIEILELEKKAEDSLHINELENAITCIQKIIDSFYQENSTEKGWYLQILARYQYRISKLESNKTQKSAFKNNNNLLKPKEGINYKKLQYISENRIKRIKEWISSNANYEELIMNIDDILESLSFGQPAEKFEKALQDLGSAIGFLSQRPDREFKKGADNLWCGEDSQYFIFECKSEVEDSRNQISKTETGQMNNHSGWFEDTYKTEKVKRILIIPTKNVSNEGNFTHKVEIMRKGKLKLLKDNVRSFFKEFKDYKIPDITDFKIQQWLGTHQLDISSLLKEYSEQYYQKK
jgi:replicative superfamily II helicase